MSLIAVAFYEASWFKIDVVVPLASDVDAVRRSVPALADEQAKAPDGKSDSVTVEDLGATEVTLRLHEWADDPHARRDIAGDLRAAIMRRLRTDGGLAAAREASGAAD